MKTFSEKLNEAMGGQEPDDVIPVLASTIAMLGIYTRADQQMFSSYVLSVIRDAYANNKTPPMKEMN
jgi:hypothetical protein